MLDACVDAGCRDEKERSKGADGAGPAGASERASSIARKGDVDTISSPHLSSSIKVAHE